MLSSHVLATGSMHRLGCMPYTHVLGLHTNVVLTPYSHVLGLHTGLVLAPYSHVLGLHTGLVLAPYSHVLGLHVYIPTWLNTMHLVWHSIQVTECGKEIAYVYNPRTRSFCFCIRCAWRTPRRCPSVSHPSCLAICCCWSQMDHRSSAPC